MIKSKAVNYKVTVEFGNGKDETIKVRSIFGLRAKVLALASKRGTIFLQAKIVPLSQTGKIVTKKYDALILNKLGDYHYFDKGQRVSLVK